MKISNQLKQKALEPNVIFINKQQERFVKAIKSMLVIDCPCL